MSLYNCLIIDDEVALSESTCEFFNMFGVKTYWVSNKKDCMDFLSKNTTEIILLDINLGNDSGFDICKELRISFDVPILFISARRSDDDVLLALNIGGDDYIQKPYSLSVLLAKVKAVLKRYTIKIENENEIIFDNFILDLKMGRLIKNGSEIKLKTMEFKLLKYLIKNKNRNISKKELFQKVWEDSITSDGTLNVHIRRLREKIEENANEPKYIKTIWGIGYVFEI